MEGLLLETSIATNQGGWPLEKIAYAIDLCRLSLVIEDPGNIFDIRHLKIKSPIGNDLTSIGIIGAVTMVRIEFINGDIIVGTPGLRLLRDHTLVSGIRLDSIVEDDRIQGRGIRNISKHDNCFGLSVNPDSNFIYTLSNGLSAT